MSFVQEMNKGPKRLQVRTLLLINENKCYVLHAFFLLY